MVAVPRAAAAAAQVEPAVLAMQLHRQAVLEVAEAKAAALQSQEPTAGLAASAAQRTAAAVEATAAEQIRRQY